MKTIQTKTLSINKQEGQYLKNRAFEKNSADVIKKEKVVVYLIPPPTVKIEKPVSYEKSKLHIKNMVSLRCKMVLKSELDKLGIIYGAVELGEVEIIGSISNEQREGLRTALLKCGLELMEDKKTVLIEKIKNVIIEMVHYSDEFPKVKYSVYISDKLNHAYTYLSNLFSEAKGISIQQYIINHKIERAKELLTYDNLTLAEIAFQLNYSSAAHLCNQFKKITGLTPSFFKKLGLQKRSTLESM